MSKKRKIVVERKGRPSEIEEKELEEQIRCRVRIEESERKKVRDELEESNKE